jgi:hypothetical protein
LRPHPARPLSRSSTCRYFWLKPFAPHVVDFTHDVERQLYEKIQHETEQHQHQKEGKFQDVKCEFSVLRRHAIHFSFPDRQRTGSGHSIGPALSRGPQCPIPGAH